MQAGGRNRIIRRGWIICFGVLLALNAGAQTPESAPPVAELTAADIETMRQNVPNLPGLDDAQRTAILDQYGEALKQVQLADEWRTKGAQFEQWRADAAQDSAKLQEKLAQPPGEPALNISDQVPLVDLEKQLSDAEAAYKTVQEAFDDLLREPGRRADRRREIPNLIAAAKQRLQEAQTQLASPPPGEPAELTSARRTAAQASIQALTQELGSYDKEVAAYDARNPLLGPRQEEAKRRLALAENTYKTLQEATAARRRIEAAQAAQEAQQVLQEITKADPVIRDRALELARENAKLADERNDEKGLNDNIESTTQQLAEVQAQLKQVNEDYERVMQRVKASGLSNAVGVLLREQRASLPNVRTLNEHIRGRRSEIARIELAQNDLREKWLGLSDTEQELQTAIKELPDRYTDHERNMIKKVVSELLQNQRNLVDALQRDNDTYLNLLVDLSGQEQQLAVLSGQFESYINENVLWIGGAPVNLETFRECWPAFAWLADPETWSIAPAALYQSLAEQYGKYAAVVLLLLAGVLIRRRCLQQIERLGKEVQKPLNTHFGQSLEALFLTVVAGAVWPSWVAALGWILAAADSEAGQLHAAGITASSVSLLAAADSETGQLHAVGHGIMATAVLLLFMETMRQILRPSGLAECHFGWPEERVGRVRKALTGLGTAALPMIVLVFAFENQSEDLWKDAVGRLGFVIAMILLSVLLHKIMRHTQLAQQELHRRLWFTERKGLRFLAKVVVVGLPLFLAALALLGFYFTALHLVYRLFWTLTLLLSVAVASSMIRRWLLLTKRRLAIQQAQRRREAAKAEAQRAADSGAAMTETVAPDEDLDLVKIDAQSQSLLRIAAALAVILGSWVIWADVIPALNMLDNIHLWPTTVDEQKEVQNDKGETQVVVVQKPGWITASNLGLSLLVAFLTFVAVRNLPGLVEILLLQRLKMGAGERYAMLAIVRYVLIGVGVLLAFGAIGVGWSKVQWLVAALGVGLGFGLQEIFANFISGLILLFERPMRVGDIVTIGSVSGSVSQIRIRATTITSWDRKELVVPNKEFVTGQLINWTLSDNVLRVCIPVGVAYGSDVKRAIAILFKLAREHARVLNDPEPQAMFTGFGDSTLNLELRVFIPSPDYFLDVRHDLLVAIDQAFKEAGIEIAFPQRDLHIRSGIELLQEALRTPKNAGPFEHS